MGHCIQFHVALKMVDLVACKFASLNIQLADYFLGSEKAKLLESGASSNQTTRAGAAQLGSENSWKGALVRLGLDFIGALLGFIYLFFRPGTP